MDALPIAHVGILVRDLAESRERWARALGLPFSPITRYRPENWSDLGNPTPHLHDARLTFCLGDRPSIEILEFVGNGTHSPDKGEGGHHLSFPPLADNAARRRELADLGVGTDGEIFHDGRWIFQFSDAAALNNVYGEWVEEHPDHPDVKDDLSPIGRLPDGTKTLFDVETILELGGRRPWSGIVEVGVAVTELDAAIEQWTAVTGYRFVDGGAIEPRDAAVPAESGTGRTAVSVGEPESIRLVEVADGVREGVFSLVIAALDLASVLDRLGSDGVPVLTTFSDESGLSQVDIDPAYLNGVVVRFRR